nr:A disintegrin and metalloproteinase with thrombospondin motifs 2-like [Onthophagus taurus]
MTAFNRVNLICFLIKVVYLIIVFGDENFDQYRIVYPKIFEKIKKFKQDVSSSFYYEENKTIKVVRIEELILNLDSPGLNFAPNFFQHNTSPCNYFKGSISGFESISIVALSICGQFLTGFIKKGSEMYFLEPSKDNEGAHYFYDAFKKRPKRSLFLNKSKKWEYFNLTGDVIDIDIDIDDSHTQDNNHDLLFTDFNNNVTLIKLDTKLSNNDDELGYFVDAAWETRIITRNNLNINTTSSPIWLEVAIAVDHTVIDFHGKDRVQQYVLSLMNIVNAIYQDPTLNANIQLVITKLFLFEEKKTAIIRLGDAVKSLQNVNAWNRKLHGTLKPEDPRHDVAVWLTRANIGGPSGYAPVSGACDPKRSCTLNRDEGLTSAFIIAHEVAHILGLSHDGAQKDGNTCGDDSYYGSIMAPMVSSTFHKFMWSECSKKEFHEKIKSFQCLMNKPISTGNEIPLNGSLQFAFTMDEQCRVEFGDGYSLCRSFDIVEVCSHLWCAKDDSPSSCRTKRAPPLEGTDCGFNKWCINGYCETIDLKRFGRNPLHHNPQNGRWSSWSSWGPCSRTCGIGAEFRSRKCDNPPPMYGGNNCFGLPEEWRLCNLGPCSEPIQDLRTQQCSNLPKYMDFEDDPKKNLTWLAFESDEHNSKCKLICISKETRELFITEENLIDGTLCSYESSTEICIQGICHHVGCDGKLFSNLRPDSCGICGGNNTECKNIKHINRKRLRRELQRMVIIPRMARNLKLEANITTTDFINPNVAFMLKDRTKQSYSVTIPNTGLYHGEIVAGTKFHYKKYSNRHFISANGPLLSEIVIYIFSPKSLIDRGIKLHLKVDYFIHKDYLNKPSRYVWILGGWGSCSKSCGGGFRQKTTACFDGQNGKIVPRKECSLLTKPHLPIEKCNNYSCNFHWITSEWESCSKTCGSHGIQHRELYCLPQNVMNETKSLNSIDFPWKFMVSPNKCGENPPPSIRHCNRIPCLSFWEFGNWSECSTSCGSGVSIRQSHCPPPDGELFYTCGPSPPQEKRICHNNNRADPICKSSRKRFLCKADQSIYCELAQLHKYCNLGFFRKYCCKSCMKHKLLRISS